MCKNAGVMTFNSKRYANKAFVHCYYVVYSAIFVLFLLSSSLNIWADNPDENQILSQKLQKLNAQLIEAGAQEDHLQVEACMDEMIAIMKKLGYKEEIIAERARMRIQYSLSVNRLVSARQAALSWLDEHPDDIVVNDLLGTIAHRMDRDNEAAEALKIVYEANPNNPVKQRRYLDTLMLVDAWEEALDLCQKIIDSKDVDAKTLIEVCEAYLRFNKPDEAETVLERLETLIPGQPYLFYAKGKLNQAKGNYEKAAKYFGKIEKGDKEWYDSSYRLGSCLLKMKQFKDASRIFVKLLTLNPYDMKVFSLMQQTLLRMRKREGAKILWGIRSELENRELIDTKAVHVLRGGDEIEHARLRALSLVEKQHYQAAGKILKSILKSYPESIQAKENLARHYIHTLQACQAEEIYENLMKIIPNEAQEQIKLEWIKTLLQQKQPDNPVSLLQKIEPQSNFGQSIYSLLGSYYLEIEGDTNKALSYLEKVKSASPEITSAMARAFLQEGQTEKAWSYFEKLPPQWNHPVALMGKICCMVQKELNKEANNLYQKVTKQFSELTPIITAEADAAIAKLNNSPEQGTLQSKAEKVKKALSRIRDLVAQAHRVGSPNFIPYLVKLSGIYWELGIEEDALRYAYLAMDSNPENIDLRKLVIQRMKQPENIFERLQLIKSLPNPETHAEYISRMETETLAMIQLTP